MPVSEAQKKASVKYLEKLDEVRIRMPKGTKTEWKDAATICGKSLNQLVVDAVENEISRMLDGDTPGGPQEATGPGVVSLPPEAIKAAQEAAEAAGETVPVFVSRAVETQAQRDALGRKMEGGERK